MEDEDRTEWDRAWSSVPHRGIPEITKIDLSGRTIYDFGEIAAATISEAPAEYLDKLYIAITLCPICGKATAENLDRVVVSIHVTFARSLNLGFGAWAHRKCLDDCPLIDEPTPIPC